MVENVSKRKRTKRGGLPHPKQAREKAGLTLRQMVKVSRVGMTTISRCEAAGEYPRNVHVRATYLAALGLTEPQVAQ